MTAFVPGVVRFLGAFQAGIGFSIVPQHHVPAIGLGIAAAAAAFGLNRGLEDLPSRRLMFLRGYVAPFVAAASVFTLFACPTSWDAAGYCAERFITDVFARTPSWAYFAALGFGAYREHALGDDRKSGPNIYR